MQWRNIVKDLEHTNGLMTKKLELSIESINNSEN